MLVVDAFDENKEYITLDYANLVQSYCSDLSYIADLLTKLAGTYNILVNSADGFNKNAFARKDDVEDAIHRAKDLGKVIDKVIDVLEIQMMLYIDYITAKDDFINTNFAFNDIIRSEIDHHVIKREKIEKKDD